MNHWLTSLITPPSFEWTCRSTPAPHQRQRQLSPDWKACAFNQERLTHRKWSRNPESSVLTGSLSVMLHNFHTAQRSTPCLCWCTWMFRPQHDAFSECMAQNTLLMPPSAGGAFLLARKLTGKNGAAENPHILLKSRHATTCLALSWAKIAESSSAPIFEPGVARCRSGFHDVSIHTTIYLLTSIHQPMNKEIIID